MKEEQLQRLGVRNGLEKVEDISRLCYENIEKKRRIAKSVERDFHYAFELVEENEFRRQITTDMGLSYEDSIYTKEVF